ncbi:MAG: Hsp20/alpha crystallin family protein [Lacibacter sp.]|jgi:HSP20 family protein
MVRLHNPVQKSINSLFDELFNELPTWGRTVNNLFTPAVNIYETNDGFHLELMAPGRNKEDFQVNVENDLLTIRYEKKQSETMNDYKVVRREFSFQPFQRSFTLDEKIDSSNIQAKYENGLLKLYLPKREEQQKLVRSISIQ